MEHYVRSMILMTYGLLWFHILLCLGGLCDVKTREPRCKSLVMAALIAKKKKQKIAMHAHRNTQAWQTLTAANEHDSFEILWRGLFLLRGLFSFIVGRTYFVLKICNTCTELLVIETKENSSTCVARWLWWHYNVVSFLRKLFLTLH